MSIVVGYNVFKDLAYVYIHIITFMGNCGHAKEFLCKVNSWTYARSLNTLYPTTIDMYM